MNKTAVYKAIVVLFAAAALLLAAACGEEPEPTPEPPAPAAATPTSQPAAPTRTPVPEAPTPTATAVPPTATPSPEPPEPTREPTAVPPSPSPTPTAEPVARTGTIEVQITDPPPPDVEQYLVTLSSVEVNKAKTGAGSPWITIANGPITFDLVELDGVEELLGSAVADPGTYRVIRLHVDGVKLKIVDVAELVDAKLPSGKIQFARSFEVEAGETTQLLLDFEGDKSLVVTGAGDYIFKPVIKLTVPVQGGKPGPTTATEPELEDTVEPTATSVPTAIPTATATPRPTATAMPTATPTATPEPTPTNDPLGDVLFLDIIRPQPSLTTTSSSYPPPRS